MGQQQLLLIILGVIIVGIAIAVGLSLFSAQSIESNRDAMINDLSNISAHAYQYYIRPTSMAGGGGTFAGYTIPIKMSSNDNGIYAVVGAGTATQITFLATSGAGNGTVQTNFQAASGKDSAFVFTGAFIR
jgi:Tfp pilus assembly protein PilE